MSDSDRPRGNSALDQGFAVLSAVVLCCFVIGVLAFSWGSNSTRDGELAATYQEETRRNQRDICRGRSGPLLAECLVEQERAGREAYRSQQDLNAQRAMSLWAFAMFIVSAATTLLTLWALWYVRGTLAATREALKDTSGATAAMMEANRIAANVQRPWITIEPKLVSYERASSKAIIFGWEIIFTNTGQMLAENLHVQTKFVPMETGGFLDAAGEWFDQYHSQVVERDAVLIPRQSTISGGQSGHSIESLSWETRKGLRKDCVVMVLAMARYRIPGEKNWRVTMRGFSIGENISYIDNSYLVYDSIDGLTLDELIMKPLGRSRAN